MRLRGSWFVVLVLLVAMCMASGGVSMAKTQLAVWDWVQD